MAYFRVQHSLAQMKGCLAEAFHSSSVSRSIEKPLRCQRQSGFRPAMPSGSQIGGHAVLAVGYDDAKHLFTIRKLLGSGRPGPRPFLYALCVCGRLQPG